MKFGPRRFSCLPELDDEVLVSFWNRAPDLRQMVPTIRARHPQPADFLILWPGRSPGWKHLASRTGRTAFLVEVPPAEYAQLRTSPGLLTPLAEGLVKHASGRRLTDCEGFVYLSSTTLH